MSTNPRCKQRPKWPQFELGTLRYQSAETTAYLVLVHYLQPHTELIDRTYHFGSFLLLFTTRLILTAFGQRSSKVPGWAGSMGPGFFYVYMGNQRARASSDWHFAGNGNDFTILLSSVLFHFASECLLACFGTLADFGVLFWGSPTDCWPYSYNIKLECEPVSTLVPLTTTAIFAIHHYFSVELSATKHVHSPDRTPQIELRAMPKPNAI